MIAIASMGNSNGFAFFNDDQGEIKITVVDAKTGEPVLDAKILPGVPYNFNEAVWQPHLIEVMKEGEISWPRERTYDKLKFRIEADGYETGHSNWIGKQVSQKILPQLLEKKIFMLQTKVPHDRSFALGPVGVRRLPSGGTEPMSLKISLTPNQGLKGRIIDLDGQPVQDASIAMAKPNSEIRLKGNNFAHADEKIPARLSDAWRLPTIYHSDEEGMFQIPAESMKHYPVVIAHPLGCRLLSYEALMNKLSAPANSVQLKPWSRIDGMVYWGDKPGKDEEFQLIYSGSSFGYPGLITILKKTRSDMGGNFGFDHLLPGMTQIGRCLQHDPKLNPNGFQSFWPIEHVEVIEGEPCSLIFGGRHKKVIGRVPMVDPKDRTLYRVSLTYESKYPMRGIPELLDEAEKTQALFQSLNHYNIELSDEGKFAIDRVIPGNYMLQVMKEDKVLFIQEVKIREDGPSQQEIELEK